ncbi:interferon-induced transmembrane protein 3-like [Ostrea edulis]|uniref:interferon-induced transmembrane protein 3-like n=1 Tax=Ostrea edulis TaxID=37623 RepID=UPI0024AED947|nr:interferon-induced transmembrane protein 3-like [Ostrea edulis]
MQSDKLQYGMQYNNIESGQSYNTMSQGVVVAQPGAVVPTVVPVIQHRNWMAHSILVCIFCFWPTGIPAIIFSKKANDAARFGDVAGATAYANSAKTFVIISLVVGICWIVITVIVRVILTVLVYT